MADSHAEGRTLAIASPQERPSPTRHDGRAVRILAGVAAVGLAMVVLWLAGRVLFTVFAGVLFAVFLLGLSDVLARLSGLSRGWSLAVVCTLLVALLAGSMLLVAPQVADQLDDLWRQMASTASNFAAHLQRYSWAKALSSQLKLDQLAGSAGDLLAGVTGAARGLLTLLGTILIISFLGLYMAVEPGLYAGGLLRLVPPDRRPRVREVLDRLDEMLRWWLIGRVFAMTVVGVLTYVGLLLLGVKLALSLAVIAAVLDFVPYIGPVVGAIPAVGIAFATSPTLAVYVVALYVVVQFVESYLLIPLVQRKVVSLAPALTLTAQILAGCSSACSEWPWRRRWPPPASCWCACSMWRTCSATGRGELCRIATSG